MQKENTGSTGAWNSFAILKKDVQTPQGTGFADYVTIHYILDDRNVPAGESSDGGQVFNGALGTMWAAAYQSSLGTVDLTQGGTESNQLDKDNILSVRAGGPHGTIHLPVKRKIVQDGVDFSENDGWIYLWMKNTDITTDDTLVWRLYIELNGRYVKVEAL